MVMEFDDLPELFFNFLERQPSMDGYDWYGHQLLVEDDDETIVSR